MRIALITRHIPSPTGSLLERTLFRRLQELSDLNFEVLVLTRYKEPDSITPLEESIAPEELPKRVEMRKPFVRFHATEWPRALPLLISFRPQCLHVIDDFSESPLRLFSVENTAVMMKRLTSGGRAVLSTRADRVSLFSYDGPSGSSTSPWGFDAIDTSWLLPAQDPTNRSEPQRVLDEKDGPRILLAGGTVNRRQWIRDIEQLLRFSFQMDRPIQLFFECDRSKLNSRQRTELMRVERTPFQQVQKTNQTATAIGSRLHLISFESYRSEMKHGFDAIIVAGSDLSTLRSEWTSTPLIQTDLQSFKFDGAITVSDAAWQSRVVREALAPEGLLNAWSSLLLAQTDRPTNSIARLY